MNAETGDAVVAAATGAITATFVEPSTVPAQAAPVDGPAGTGDADADGERAPRRRRRRTRRRPEGAEAGAVATDEG
ncbi:hypothetical protein ACFXHK_39690 [Embleya sp. NPDC059267]|uniref:hypothetical protein n=1 Tax=Embleya sp. NPDC059267 TaxID=3346798 RepID=UPI0036B9A22C